MMYRTEQPLMVLAYNNNHDAAIPIPSGELVEILDQRRMTGL